MYEYLYIRDAYNSENKTKQNKLEIIQISNDNKNKKYILLYPDKRALS